FMRHMTQKMSREGIQARMPFVLEVQ
ncbi:MAG: hypothetical protein ACI834_000296, partial [Colwellia sp.]